MTRRLSLLAALAALAGCGGADTSPDRARARFDATVAYLRTSFEADGGRLESAFLADGTDSNGRAGQFVCGVALDGRRGLRAFASPAREGGAHEVMATDVANRGERAWYQQNCRTPARDASGQEIRFEAAAGAAPAAQPVANPTPSEAAPPAVEPSDAKDPAAPIDEAIEAPVDDKVPE